MIRARRKLTFATGSAPPPVWAPSGQSREVSAAENSHTSGASVQILLLTCGAGGARTHDRRIMRVAADSSPPFATVLIRASVLSRPLVDGGELQPELQPTRSRRRHGSTGSAAYPLTRVARPLRTRNTTGQCTQPGGDRTASAHPCSARQPPHECLEPHQRPAVEPPPLPRGIRHQRCRL